MVHVIEATLTWKGIVQVIISIHLGWHVRRFGDIGGPLMIPKMLPLPRKRPIRKIEKSALSLLLFSHKMRNPMFVIVPKFDVEGVLGSAKGLCSVSFFANRATLKCMGHSQAWRVPWNGCQQTDWTLGDIEVKWRSVGESKHEVVSIDCDKELEKNI